MTEIFDADARAAWEGSRDGIKFLREAMDALAGGDYIKAEALYRVAMDELGQLSDSFGLAASKERSRIRSGRDQS